MELHVFKRILRSAIQKAVFYLSVFRQSVSGVIKRLLKRDYTVRDAAILFMLALCLGVAVKISVSGTLTIGFQDYALAPVGKTIDMNMLQKRLLDDGGSVSLDGPTEGKACFE